jgi:F420-dependent hydroxymycolic acid dehydrogenase
MDDAVLNPVAASAAAEARQKTAGLRDGMIGYMLAHEQFTVPQLVEIGAAAEKAGFDFLASSDHFQPWQANEGHSDEPWATMAALGTRAPSALMGTFVTCPTLRYSPPVVAEAFASLSLLYPGRIFLGVGSGEALNEQAATGAWPDWNERWERLIEAIGVIRQLWTGQHVSHHGRYYTVDARLYDAPPEPIPILTAANGQKAMRLAGEHGDGLITDPATWMEYKGAWEAGAKAAGKNPADMPVIAEKFVVVGDETEAKKAAKLWRFIPKAFESYFGIADPVEIQRRAEAEVPMDERFFEEWAIGTDPNTHIEAIQELFDSGIKLVNIHIGQMDQPRAIEFYRAKVLPALRHPKS